MPTEAWRPREIEALFLGQAGVRLRIGGLTIYVDPYLTDAVAERFGEALHRLVPSPLAPADVTDADWVLITHEHLDHLEPQTLREIARRSPGAQFVCPAPWIGALQECGIRRERILRAQEAWIPLAREVSVHPVPAAHPTIERDAEGELLRVGYVLQVDGRRIYHAGDTSPDEAIVRAVRAFEPIATALIPVNERNHYRERAGILGNMSVREAFAFCEELGARTLVPIHWDLFAPNSVLPEEITLLHGRLAPPFALRFAPETL